jgi:hypothetical protein
MAQVAAPLLELSSGGSSMSSTREVRIDERNQHTAFLLEGVSQGVISGRGQASEHS